MTGRAERGEYAKTAQTRERILDAAMQAFGQHGTRGSTLGAIAEQVGMSQAGLLHHFGSKTGLLLAVLDRFDREESPDPPPRTVADGVAYVRDELARGAGRPGLFQLHVTLSAEATDPDHPAHDHFVERYDRVVEEFRSAVAGPPGQPALADGVDATALAHLVVAAMDGLQLQKLLNDDVDVEASIDLLLTALVTAYGARPD